MKKNTKVKIEKIIFFVFSLAFFYGFICIVWDFIWLLLGGNIIYFYRLFPLEMYKGTWFSVSFMVCSYLFLFYYWFSSNCKRMKKEFKKC